MKIYKIPVFLATIAVASAILLFSSCKHDLGIPAGTPEICFDSLVMPIFQTSCNMQGCHGGTSEAHFQFNTYDDILQGITAGNPDQSNIYRAITGKGENLMPPSQPISMDNRTIIRYWILQGALHTSCPGGPPIK